jgi:hypothetical protein
MLDCPWCGQITRLHFIRSHYECASCHRPVADCCDGEKAEAETVIEFRGEGIAQSAISSESHSGQTPESAPKTQGTDE